MAWVSSRWLSSRWGWGSESKVERDPIVVEEPAIGAVGAGSPDQLVHEQAIAAINALNLSEVRADLGFVTESNPEVSIIVPVYNKTAFTLNCLDSLRQLKTRRRFEIIIMDDRSTEAEVGLLRDIPGVRYVQNDENLGFLRTCNRASEIARGRFLLFLNNDTRVAEDWLDAMCSTFEQHDRVGIVGSKLCYPDGSLQEAGGVVWRDGSGWNYGKGNDPTHPRFNYVRDVDYVSGASLMIPSELFAQVGSFDERFAPAYYEDTDLAFAVRKAGFRVLYQPAAEVIHYEGISSGTSLTAGAKSHQASNAVTFERKWRLELSRHFPGGSARPLMAADRIALGHILIIDACTPTPSKDSGSLDMVNLIQILLDLGYRVHYANAYENLEDQGASTRRLQQMGVETLLAPHYASVDVYLAANEIVFDHVVLSRYLIAQNHIDSVKNHCPGASVIFNTVDLHGLRELREAELLGDPKLIEQARYTEHCELQVISAADVSIVLSEVERKHLADLGHDQVAVLPLIRVPNGRGPTRFEERSGVVFIGGFAHPPNRDALDWLLFDIWPAVRRRCRDTGAPPITLKIIGGGLPDRIWNEAAPDVVIFGHLDNIEVVFGESRLSVAPLRYGAGLKGKVATSMDYGLPVIGTDVAFEGMPRSEVSFSDLVVEAGSTEEFAQRIVELHRDPVRWEALSAAGVNYVRQQYSVAVLADRVRRLLASLEEQASDSGAATSGSQNVGVEVCGAAQNRTKAKIVDRSSP